ncbi:MAG: bifunctional glutamate--cysteine ligase GshA/glutathione synthetase GshB [Bacillus sp. (in: firmicutes)]
MAFDILRNLTIAQLLNANFGLEREGLRVDEKGLLSLKPHPAVFGDKKENPYITTDFSESQLELITPVFQKAEEVIDFLDSLYNIAVLELEDEYIWPQSMPSITPDDHDIPLAVFSNESNDQKYREYLIAKYGGKKQLISGIHVNFSFGDAFWEALYRTDHQARSMREFKDDLYLKLTRNYLRYHWLLIYLLGATNTIHRTFEENCVANLEEISDETYSDEGAVSFRNSSCGYQNQQTIMLDYTSIQNYINSIESYVKNGVLKDIRELYAQVRVKSSGMYSTDHLLQNGIEYVEIRTIDCNPFVKSGLAVEDLHFIHLFLLYCIVKEESLYEDWQAEGKYNSQTVAVKGQSQDTLLLRDGQHLSMQVWGMELLEELCTMNRTLGLPFGSIIKEKMEVMMHHEKTYSHHIAKLCHEKGYIGAHMELAQAYKAEAYAERFRLKPYTDLELSTQHLLIECIKRGISFDLLDRSENFVQLTKGQRTEYVKQATKTSKDQYISVLMMENKSVTKKILHRHHISAPGGDEYNDRESAKVIISKWIGKPVVIKPKSTNFGLGISIFPNGTDKEDLLKGLEIAFAEDTSVLIEPFVKGKEYRFLVIGEKVVAVLHRVPANVVGDGKSTIAELVAVKNENPLRGKGYKTPLEKIEIDENMKLFLHQQRKTVDTILPEGSLQYLRENSNISTGGDSVDVTEYAPSRFKEMAVQAAKAVGANICGVDMMIEDFLDETSSYAIIELNFNPAIHIHAYPYKGTERNIGYEILKLLELV